MSLARGRELLIGARAGLLDPKHVKAIGSARWLYDWILWRVTSEHDGLGRVLGGSPVRCEEIAADLGVGLRTIYRWMNRLRGRYILTRHVIRHGRHGLAIEVLRSKKFHPGKPAGVLHISTASTTNPAKAGRDNPASFGRLNPARSGSFLKEERKPLTESNGKGNFGFLEDSRGGAGQRKAKPQFPPISEEEKQRRKAAEIAPASAKATAGKPACAPPSAGGRATTRLRRDFGAPPRTNVGERFVGMGLRPGPMNPAFPLVVGAHPESSGTGHDAALKGGATRRGDEGDSGTTREAIVGRVSNPPPPTDRCWGVGRGAVIAPVAGDLAREVFMAMRRVSRAKAMPAESEARRREALERQRRELLERVERRRLPP